MTDLEKNTQHENESYHGEMHEYDGIIEHDNQLPLWWLATLWLCTIFGVCYWAYYHTFAIGLNQEQILAQEVKADQEKQKQQAQSFKPDDLLAMSKDLALVEEGKSVFTTNCVACHGEKGEGKIGPNLTDSAWIHGGEAAQILESVAKGWPSFGMMAWEPILGPKKVKAVTAYLLTIKDSNVAGGKAAEGPRDAQVPAQPTEQAPAQPTEQAPVQPTEQAPAQPTEQAPAQPTEQAPAQPTEQAPAQPKEMTAEEKALDASLMALSKKSAQVKAGKEVYTANCLACHGDSGQGLVGPNLTDSSWLHGGKAYQIHAVVTKGWPNTAMIAWDPILGKEKVNQVVAFLLSIKNTNKAGKAAEGVAE
jgi:cytochrome c oxidase cbb3-type subunit 3